MARISRGWVVALLLLPLLPVRSALGAQGEPQVFIVVSITPVGPRTFDVKLQNPRTRYIHSVTVRIDFPLKVGDRVTERREGNRVILTPVGPEQPRPPALGDLLVRGRYRAVDAARRPLRYAIRGLGTGRVAGQVEVAGQKHDLSAADLQRRSDGENRGFRANENLFDRVTGRQWNWVGSDRSGGPNRPIRPGGIGNVNVGCLNAFDCAAKKHDIQFWLQAHFEVGAQVALEINGAWRTYRVADADAVNQEVMEEFTVAAQGVLNRALRQAIAQGNQQRANRLRGMQNDLRLAFWDPRHIGAIRAILHEPEFRPFLE